MSRHTEDLSSAIDASPPRVTAIYARPPGLLRWFRGVLWPRVFCFRLQQLPSWSLTYSCLNYDAVASSVSEAGWNNDEDLVVRLLGIMLAAWG